VGTFGANITLCHTCANACPPPRRGGCPCRADASGRDIIELASAGQCPAGLFGSAASGPPAVAPLKSVNWADLGRAMWAELHGRALSPVGLCASWLAEWTSRIPCGDCRRHWRALLVELPPVFGEGAFGWSVAAHNAVNRRLGKVERSEADARGKWSVEGAPKVVREAVEG
jgi:hypothetical protein